MIGILKTPGYAGAYVHGRYSSRRTVEPDGMVRSGLVERPRAEWPVLIKDHHEGFITWADYLAKQATIRGRDGKRHTQTDKLKSVVKQWATQQEAAIARGEFRDPMLGDIKVASWHERVVRARGIEDITKAKNASLWRTHCEPEWGGWQMGAITAGRPGVGQLPQGHTPGPAQGQGRRSG